MSRSGCNDRIEDPEADALADERLGEFHERAVPEIVGFRLEAQPEERDVSDAGIQHATCGKAQVGLIAPHDAADQRDLDAVHSCDVYESGQVFGETRAAECESRPEVRRRNVEPIFETKKPHHLA